MDILFISDIHLSEDKPIITDHFLFFLHKYAIKAKALYILGDFFDFWIGDDNLNKLHLTIAKELKELHNNGVYCYFIHGNRDFLLGKKFAKESGIILLPNETIIKLYGINILILHGDILCSNDILYQFYRKYIYNPWCQWLFLILPLSIRRKIAIKIRQYSKLFNSKNSNNIDNINEQTVFHKFKHNHIDWIIHGHIHKPCIHHLNINNKVLYRAVLGAWNQNGSMIKITPSNIELLSIIFH